VLILESGKGGFQKHSFSSPITSCFGFMHQVFLTKKYSEIYFPFRIEYMQGKQDFTNKDNSDYCWGILAWHSNIHPKASQPKPRVRI